MLSRKKLTALATILFLALTIFPTHAFAVDQTSKVNASASYLTIVNSNTLYPYDTKEKDPEENLKQIKIFFRSARLATLYSQWGDTVSFYIKASSKEITGWVDKDASNGYDTSRETLNGESLTSSIGYYVEDARLARDGSISLYVGSATSGTYTIYIFADQGGGPGDLIGNSVPVTVEGANEEIRLQVLNELETNTLGGHAGTAADPYEIASGEEAVLRATVRQNNNVAEDREVEFSVSFNYSVYEILGTDETRENGTASIDFDFEDAGIYSFKATTANGSTKEIYIKCLPGAAADVEAISKDDQDIVINEPVTLEFLIMDKNDNPVDTGGKKIIELRVATAPEFSKYLNYSIDVASNSEGKVSLTLTPDRKGEYSVRCSIKNTNASDRLEFSAAQFGYAEEMELSLERSGETVPSVRYIDENNDGIPEPSGILKVVLINENGARRVASGSTLNDIIFTSFNAAVEVNTKGQITVTQMSLTGNVTISVRDTANMLNKNYTLIVAGEPANLMYQVKPSGKKADIILQYADSAGTPTWYKAGEEYTLTSPDAGLSYSFVKPFNYGGSASFTATGEDFKIYQLMVSTKQKILNNSIKLSFATTSQVSGTGAKNVTMFIGLKSYSQDGVSKISDVAPFIKDGRTFVAVRPLGEAFGAEVDWDAATQTVTMTRTDLELTIVIGQSRITKIQNGITTYITADVPAFITDEGRTVLPFRAVGDAFGAAVAYDAATNSVSYRQ